MNRLASRSSTPMSGSRRVSVAGRTQLTVLALILLAGLVAGYFILRGGSHGDEGHDHDAQHAQAEGHEEAGPGSAAASSGAHAIPFTDEQMRTAGVVLEAAGPATLRSVRRLPGEIKLNEDRTAHVVPRVAGVVERVVADLGQGVKRGEVLAVIASAGLGELRSELQAARKRLLIAEATHTRERRLWEEGISPEQDVLLARQAQREAEIAVANARQKLAALGAAEGAAEGVAGLSRYELRAPFDGVVVEKHLTLGESVAADTVVFTLSDLASVWAELSVAPAELAAVRVGATARVRAAEFDAVAEGRVAYVGALIGAATRTATARVVLANPQGAWRPGLFVNVELEAGSREAPVTVPRDALHEVEGQPGVFVRTAGGFRFQPVRVASAGAGDGVGVGARIEILEGLAAGTRVAAAGSFAVKAELGKSQAEHSH